MARPPYKNLGIAVIAFSLFFAQPGYAGCLSNIVNSLRKTAETHPVSQAVLARVADTAPKLIKPLMKNLEGRTVPFTDKNTGKTFELSFGKSFGAGFFGRVYAIDKGPQEFIGGYRGEVCAKLGHGLKGTAGAKQLSYSRKALLGEVRNYEELVKLNEIARKTPQYPANPAWGDRLPVAPILGMVDTDQGPVVFKAMIKGKGFEDLASIRDITPEMRAGLADIIAYVKAVDQAKRTLGGTFATDLRPPNIVWVDDPALLNELHYNGPGWVFYEQDTLPAGVPAYFGKSVDDYVKEAALYLNRAAKK